MRGASPASRCHHVGRSLTPIRRGGLGGFPALAAALGCAAAGRAAAGRAAAGRLNCCDRSAGAAGCACGMACG